MKIYYIIIGFFQIKHLKLAGGKHKFLPMSSPPLRPPKAGKLPPLPIGLLRYTSEERGWGRGKLTKISNYEILSPLSDFTKCT
jgi:hypothetical protein